LLGIQDVGANPAAPMLPQKVFVLHQPNTVPTVSTGAATEAAVAGQYWQPNAAGAM